MVNRFCIVDGCYNHTGTSSALTFHPLPHKNEELMRKWKEVVSISRSRGFICSEHFHSDSFYYNSIHRLWTLKKEGVPIVGIPERWLHKVRGKPLQKIEAKSSNEPVRSRKEGIQQWRDLATQIHGDRIKIEEKLRLRNISHDGLASDEDFSDNDDRPWWFTRDLAQEAQENDASFWDETYSEAWTKLWPDEEIEMTGKIAKKSGVSVMKRFLALNDSESSSEENGETVNNDNYIEEYLEEETPPTSPGLRPHPGATDIFVDGEISMDYFMQEETITNKQTPLDKCVRICSVKTDVHRKLKPIVVQPVLNFRAEQSILEMPAFLGFPRLAASSDRKTTVLEVAKKIAEANVRKCIGVAEIQPRARKKRKAGRLCAKNSKLTNAFSVVRRKNSIDIKPKLPLLKKKKVKSAIKLRSSEILKFRRMVGKLQIAVRKAKEDLKWIRSR